MIKFGITAGSFDLTHAGHYLMFKECRAQVDHLIVCLQSNPNLDRLDKNVPVQTCQERYIQVSACRYVDSIIEYDTEADLLEIFKKYIFDIRFIGADWEGKPYTGHDLPGMKEKVIFNSRNHEYSSSNLRRRVTNAENMKYLVDLNRRDNPSVPSWPPKSFS